jgi:alkyl sulfatase BDS1-like metallo-beta-lactamase superfamily hydrolase
MLTAHCSLVLRFDVRLTDVNEEYALVVENGVLNHYQGRQLDNVNATLITTRAALNGILMGEATAADKLASGEAVIEGDGSNLGEFVSMLDNFEFWFNIATP